MLHHLFSLTLVAVLALLSTVLAVGNLPTLVNLRIEGSTTTIFEGSIITQGHNVTTPSGGTHECNGKNNNANPFAGPTCTSALSDAAQLQHFTFDGTFSIQFDDFFITSIGGDTQTSTEFWGILLNFEFIPVGGCQQEVKVNDEILFAFNAFNKDHFLKLAGPTTAFIGVPVVFTVTDGSTGSPVAGALLEGKTTDANGHVSVTFTKLGATQLKATQADSIRSNAITVGVV